MKNVLMVNFKNYREGVGANAEKLAVLIEEESRNYNVDVFLVVNPADVFRVSKVTKLKILSVAEPFSFGRHTGFVIPEALKENGAFGLLINHSEHSIDLEKIGFLVRACNNLDLMSVVCAPNLDVLKQVLEVNPDFVALEPPELIAGDVSVSNAEPDVISSAVRLVNSRIPLLCGAGVKHSGDVAKALELGASGVLVASGIVEASDKRSVLKEFLSVLNK